MEEGEGEEGEGQGEAAEEQEQEGQINTQDPMSLIQTVAQTTVLESPDDNTNNIVVQQDGEQLYLADKNADELNQYFNQIGNNASNVISYNESGAFVSADSNYNVNNVQGVSATQGINQSLQQGSQSSNANFDFNNIAVENSTVYIDPNANDFNQYFQQQTTTDASATGNVNYGTTSSTSYYQNVVGPSTNIDYNILSSQNTGTFGLNNANLGQSSATNNNFDLSQYNYSQTGNEISASYTIPATSASAINYTGGQQIGSSFSEYKSTQVTTKNASKSYVAPSQSYSYKYTFGNTLPGTYQA